jgi:glycosyltransferase involved in cell wall biosynthesis
MNNITNNPLVSIIVRTKDRPKPLKRALQSVAAQAEMEKILSVGKEIFLLVY